jgi:protease-4
MDQHTQPPAPPTPPPQWSTQPTPPPRQGMSAGAKWAIGCGAAFVLAVIAVIVLIIAMVGLIGAGARYGGTTTGGNMALIRVEGVITAGGAGGGPFGGGGASAEEIVQELQKAATDSGVKAILIRINSPGGSAAGSQEMYRQVREVRERKPVFVSMGDVAASGGYYVASASDRIFADPGTITGSIGVISASIELSGLLNKIGIKPEVMKEGKYKDMGSGLRPLTDQERQLTQGMLANVYEQFIGAVADGRNLPADQVRKLATGQVFTGEQALKLKLVDELGGMRPAALALAKKAGISGEPKLKEYRRHSLMDVLFGDISSTKLHGMRGILYDRVADLITRGALEAEGQQ